MGAAAMGAFDPVGASPSPSLGSTGSFEDDDKENGPYPADKENGPNPVSNLDAFPSAARSGGVPVADRAPLLGGEGPQGPSPTPGSLVRPDKLPQHQSGGGRSSGQKGREGGVSSASRALRSRGAFGVPAPGFSARRMMSSPHSSLPLPSAPLGVVKALSPAEGGRAAFSNQTPLLLPSMSLQLKPAGYSNDRWAPRCSNYIWTGQRHTIECMAS
jgi:hypothetical protein